MKVNCKEVLKFLSGAAFVGAGANFYLYLNHISVPFLGFTITPELMGFRALIGFILFLIFFHFGYLKK